MSHPEMAAMLFKSAQRVIYKRATVVEAICTLGFHQELGIASDAQALSNFHKLLKPTFQIYEKPNEIEVHAEEKSVAGDSSRNWKHVFKTEDELASVRLREDAISFSSQDYEGWESFLGSLKRILLAMERVWEVSEYTYSGMNYINIIAPSFIGIDKGDLSKCLNPYINGPLGAREFANVEGLGMLNVFSIPLNSSLTASVETGSVYNKESSETGVVLKITIWNSEQAGGADVTLKQLEAVHTVARDCFRWCITDFLHEKMDPESI